MLANAHPSTNPTRPPTKAASLAVLSMLISKFIMLSLQQEGHECPKDGSGYDGGNEIKAAANWAELLLGDVCGLAVLLQPFYSILKLVEFSQSSVGLLWWPAMACVVLHICGLFRLVNARSASILAIGV